MKNPFTEKFDRIEGYWFPILVGIGAVWCEIFHVAGYEVGLFATGILVVVGGLMAFKAEGRSK